VIEGSSECSRQSRYAIGRSIGYRVAEGIGGGGAEIEVRWRGGQKAERLDWIG
jgi:hypothetical protein